MRLPVVTCDEELAHTPPQAFHLSSFGYAACASLKDPPGPQLWKLLLEFYLLDGFKTSNEPLLVSQPDELAHQGLVQNFPGEPDGTLACASLGYVKGFARTTSALAIAYFCFANQIDLKDICPKLHTSMRAVYAHYLPMESKVEESLKNMKISCTGSIRRPPNVVQQTSTILRLVQTGGLKDYQEYVRRYNKQVPRTFQIIGQRATSLRLLFELAPSSVVCEIVKHVGKRGFDGCCWSDDNLSSKKMYPGYLYPGKGKKWIARSRVTNESMLLHVLCAQADHDNKPVYMQKKMTSHEHLVIAEKAAVCWHLGQEFLQIVPVTPEVLKSGTCSLLKFSKFTFKYTLSQSELGFAQLAGQFFRIQVSKRFLELLGLPSLLGHSSGFTV